MGDVLLTLRINFSASNLDEDAEIVVVPLEAQHERGADQRVTDFAGVADTELPYFSFAQYNPFRWNFFDDFHSKFLT